MVNTAGNQMTPWFQEAMNIAIQEIGKAHTEAMRQLLIKEFPYWKQWVADRYGSAYGELLAQEMPHEGHANWRNPGEIFKNLTEPEINTVTAGRTRWGGELAYWTWDTLIKREIYQGGRESETPKKSEYNIEYSYTTKSGKTRTISKTLVVTTRNVPWHLLNIIEYGCVDPVDMSIIYLQTGKGLVGFMTNKLANAGNVSAKSAYYQTPRGFEAKHIMGLFSSALANKWRGYIAKTLNEAIPKGLSKSPLNRATVQHIKMGY